MTDYFERLDSWLDGDDAGTAPLELLRTRGIEVVPEETLDDAALPAELWKLINALADLGVILSFTGHLSDRALYRKIVADILPQRALLMPDVPGAFSCHDLCAVGCEEDEIDYLTYYADDEERTWWLEDNPGRTLPERKPLPYDRDRLLPTMEQRVAMLETRS